MFLASMICRESRVLIDRAATAIIVKVMMPPEKYKRAKRRHTTWIKLSVADYTALEDLMDTWHEQQDQAFQGFVARIDGKQQWSLASRFQLTGVV